MDNFPNARRYALEKAVDRDLRDIGRAINAIRVRVQGKLSVRQRIASRPLFWLGAALVVGLLFGMRRR